MNKFRSAVGWSRTVVTNALRLFQLPATVQRLVRDGSISAGHARALLMTPDRELQERLAKSAIEGSLSVRALEEVVRSHLREDDEEAAGDGGDSVAGTSSVSQPARPQPLVDFVHLESWNSRNCSRHASTRA